MNDHVSFATQSTEGEKLSPGFHPLAEIFSLLPQDGQVTWEGEEEDVGIVTGKLNTDLLRHMCMHQAKLLRKKKSY